jgi:type I restriction enzyme R subunit
MTPVSMVESVVEEAALAWMLERGYTILYGPDIALGEPDAERIDASYHDVILDGRFKESLSRLNPGLSADALDDAYRKLTRVNAPTLIERNRAIHRMFVDGIPVSDRRKDGLLPECRQRSSTMMTMIKMIGSRSTNSPSSRPTQPSPDVILFVNGLPLAVIELKNPADESATIWTAHQQLVTYQNQISTLFNTNVAMVVSDGVQARVGVLGLGVNGSSRGGPSPVETTFPRGGGASSVIGGGVRQTPFSRPDPLFHRL